MQQYDTLESSHESTDSDGQRHGSNSIGAESESSILGVVGAPSATAGRGSIVGTRNIGVVIPKRGHFDGESLRCTISGFP